MKWTIATVFILLVVGAAFASERYPQGERYPEARAGGTQELADGILVSWSSSTKIDCGSTVGDGNCLITDNAGTQGIKIDTATSDGVVAFQDEAGGTLLLWAHQIAADNQLQIGKSTLQMRLGYIADDGVRFGVHATDGRANNYVVILNQADFGASLGLGTPAANPTLLIGADNIDSVATNRLKLYHDQTDGVITSDAGSVKLDDEVEVTGVSGDGTGKAVCVKADGDLGTCSDAVGAGGTCTCG